MKETILQLERVMAVFNHVGQGLYHPGMSRPPLSRDIGLRFRDRTKNVFPFTSVDALTNAYRDNGIREGLFDILNTEEEISQYHPIRLSQVLVHYRQEVETLTEQEVNVMTMALSEILSRTLFWKMTTDSTSLDKISLDIYQLLYILLDCPAP